MIRNDPLIEGIPIPTPEGDFSESAHSEMRERAFADDTGVALASDASLNQLFEIADQYSLGSGSKLQVEKTVGFRFGTAKAVTPPPEHLLTWHRYGIDPVPPHHKYLGNALGTPDQVAAQWEAKLGELEAELDQALLSAKIPRTVFGRSLWVKNYFAAKVWYTFRFQKPSASEQSRLLTFLQRQINRLTFGSFHFVKSSTAKHAFEDGGLCLLDPEMHLKAESAMLVKELLCEPSGSHPWKNFWRYTLNCAYPDLNMGLRLITSSCTFQLLHRHETASVLQRHAFDAWAENDVQFTPPPYKPLSQDKMGPNADHLPVTTKVAPRSITK